MLPLEHQYWLEVHAAGDVNKLVPVRERVGGLAGLD